MGRKREASHRLLPYSVLEPRLRRMMCRLPASLSLSLSLSSGTRPTPACSSRSTSTGRSVLPASVETRGLSGECCFGPQGPGCGGNECRKGCANAQVKTQTTLARPGAGLRRRGFHLTSLDTLCHTERLSRFSISCAHDFSAWALSIRLSPQFGIRFFVFRSQFNVRSTGSRL